MGGITSGSFSYYTPEEILESERVAKLQNIAFDFVTNVIYYGVPVRSGKKSRDVRSAVWIEPTSELIDEMLSNGDATLKELLLNVPSGVMIDSKCQVKIFFSLGDDSLEYHLTVEDIVRYKSDVVLASLAVTTECIAGEAGQKYAASSVPVRVIPKPPVADGLTTTEISLNWLNSLPYPVGIILHVEVQYALYDPTLVDCYEEDEEDKNEDVSHGESGRDDEDDGKRKDNVTGYRNKNQNKLDHNKHIPQKNDANKHKRDASPETADIKILKHVKLYSLVSKSYSKQAFYTHKLDYLQPGTSYMFRLRYRSDTQWSEFSKASTVITTKADRPARPVAPQCIAITSNAIEMSWVEHTKDNGSPIIAYILRARSVGDTFIELYRGMDRSYLALGMYPEFAYSFQLAVVNAIGMSDYSTMVNLQTPQRNKAPRLNSAANPTTFIQGGFNQTQIILAMQCKDAWRECWDPKTEQIFYFNKIIATRQLEKPACLKDKEKKKSSFEIENLSFKQQSEKDLEKEREVAFRKKRYRLLRALHKNKYNVINSSSSGSNSPVRQSAMLSNRGSPQPTTIDTTAPTLTYNTFTTITNNTNTNTSSHDTVTHGVTASDDDTAFSTTILLNTYTATDSSVSPQQQSKLNQVLKLELRRNYMLADCYKVFSGMKITDFYRRIKVEFVGEAGIDSGGLSKEAFLLLTKQASVFVGPHCKKVHNGVQIGCSRLSGQLRPASTTTGDVIESEDGGARTSLTSAAMVVSKRDTASKSVESQEEQEGLFFVSNSTISAMNAQPEHSVLTATHSAVLTQETVDELSNAYTVNQTQFFSFLGRLLGKALFDRQLIDFPLSSMLLQHMLGGLFMDKLTSTGNIISPKSPTKGTASNNVFLVNDEKECLKAEVLQMLIEIKGLDAVLYKQLFWMATNDISGIIYETFSVSENGKSLPLCASGDSKDVTEDNKYEYIQLMILYKTKYSASDSLFPFLAAFHELVPLDILKKNEITKEELNLILNGKPTVDVEEIRAYCIYQTEEPDEFNETCDAIVWLWRLFREFDDTQRRLLLRFFTGSSRVPLDGYDPPLNITQGKAMAKDSLPRAHTCFNQLVLPEYSRFEICRGKVLFAIQNTAGFELS